VAQATPPPTRALDEEKPMMRIAVIVAGLVVNQPELQPTAPREALWPERAHHAVEFRVDDDRGLLSFRLALADEGIDAPIDSIQLVVTDERGRRAILSVRLHAESANGRMTTAFQLTRGTARRALLRIGLRDAESRPVRTYVLPIADYVELSDPAETTEFQHRLERYADTEPQRGPLTRTRPEDLRPQLDRLEPPRAKVIPKPVHE
jgi:hypothetical protein